MGLLSWALLKKELPSLKRRQSAPPTPSNIYEDYDPDSHRDQYLKAFEEFKERGYKYHKPKVQKIEEEGESLPKIRELTDEELKQTPASSQKSDQIENEVANTTADIEKSQQKVESESGKRDRFSLPFKMSRSLINKSFHRKNAKKSNQSVNNTSVNNNTIYEEEVFVCDGNQSVNSVSFNAQLESPPKKFYKHNSIPYPNEISPCKEAVKYTTPRKSPRKIADSRQQSCGRFLSYISPNSKKNQSRSDSSTSRNSGSFKHYNSSLSDDVDIPKKSQHHNQQMVLNQAYEKSVNKHGDLVEYAVPYSERGRHEYQPPIKLSNDSGVKSFGHCEDVIDANFEFLNDSKWNGHFGDLSASKVEKETRANVTVTDLDKSLDGSRSIDLYDKRTNKRNNEGLSELDSLEQWSLNIPQRSLPNNVLTPTIKKNHIIECKPKEIKQKISVLRNTIATPLDFSSGIFRKTTVALRKCCPRDLESVRLVEEAIERDYEILSKIKHSNIVLLMAACFNKKLINHMTLVLEPVDYTLNYYLHQMDETLSIFESISVVQQIATASLYLQECGYIHSNISSHNILVRKHPWCVKLSSFELATVVDCSDVRAEIEITYGRMNKKKSVVSECAELPRYSIGEDKNVSLKEQYLQMSKRSPMLKCSPDTQHAYMNMPSKYLVYNTHYRQHLSLHNFQAPELLTTASKFVFPTTKTDVYSLCLLLWEILNKCVPFVVYSKLDMERMIAKNKLNLPFFERERCHLFLAIFRVGLALKPENRTMDVQQLITMLEDVKFEIHSSHEDLDAEDFYHEDCLNGIDPELKNLYVNTTPQALMSPGFHKNYVTPARKIEPENKNEDDLGWSIGSLLQGSLLEFKKSLDDPERTSTLKKRKKPARKFVKQQVRELFKESNHEESTEDISELSQAKLNENLDAMADDIRFSRENILDEFREEIYNSQKTANDEVIGPLIVTENKLPSKMKVDRHVEITEPKKFTTPEVVGYKIKRRNLNDSKSVDNLLDTSIPSSAAKRKFLNSKMASSPSEYRFTIGDYSLPQTPIARKNKIRRNAWLSNQKLCPSEDDIDNELVAQDDNNQSLPLDKSKALNVSIRIVHNKVTPKKDAKEDTKREVNPSVKSIVKFFDSTKEPSRTDVPIFYDQRPITPNKVEDNSIKDTAATDTAKILNDQITDLTSAIRNCLSTSQRDSFDNNVERNGTFSNASTLPMSQKNEQQTVLQDLKETMINFKSSSSQPQDNTLFENKLWKREMNICNRSLGTNDGEDDESNIIAPKWGSVRDTILKFEKRGELIKKTSSTDTTEVTSMNKKSDQMAGNQQTYFKLNDANTLIKRTIYRESILSGVDLTSVDKQMPFFDLAGEKLTTCVTLNMRQICRRSSDVGLADRCQNEGDVRHTICGSDKGLLTFNTGTMSNSLGGTPSAVTRYVCSKCASRMSTDELKALTYESTAVFSGLCLTNGDDEYSQKRCQAFVNTQTTRSIEDLYIDDDFLHGLGANMELQSDCSDFLDFNMISTDFFNTKSDSAENNSQITVDKSI